ncbi:MAG: ATP-binding protein [Bacilli bacterium]|nr:ATP-binding protein [Bacilli bacterium]
MFGKIVYINNNMAHIKLNGNEEVIANLMNMHVVFEDDNKKILGEVEDIGEELVKVRFLGEIVNDKFMGGVIRKPSLQAKLRIINQDELNLIVGDRTNNSLVIGGSPLYNNYPISADINDLFSNHLTILGNSGSGKSWGVARLLQNLFASKTVLPFKANIFLFDAYGEYHNAFSDLSKLNPNYNFKIITTNLNQSSAEVLKVPLWLLDVDDYALLLGASSHSQLPIIERILKLVRIFGEDSEKALAYKNHLIAKAIMTILYTNQTSSSKRNDIFAILATCQTDKFNLEAPVQGLGYVRKFRDCFVINTQGDFTESILVTDYISSFIDENLEGYEPSKTVFFTLEDLEKATDFTLISEGLLRNEASYNDAITLKVRLHSIVTGENNVYLRYPKYISLESYIASLVSINGKKAQIINFNLEDVPDWFAKVITKIYAKMFFKFTKGLKKRASIPLHIFLEEAHRYVQNDNDSFLLGYNIFDRIAKEGRKYGLMLNLISQRPVEISETVISQCSNFLIFKLNHPRDLDYIKKMIPNISSEIVEKQKSLQPGTCVAFGKAFKVPMIISLNKPSPVPSSSNADVSNSWRVNNEK